MIPESLNLRARKNLPELPYLPLVVIQLDHLQEPKAHSLWYPIFSMGYPKWYKILPPVAKVLLESRRKAVWEPRSVPQDTRMIKLLQRDESHCKHPGRQKTYSQLGESKGHVPLSQAWVSAGVEWYPSSLPRNLLFCPHMVL